MSVDYRASLIYGYCIPGQKVKHISEELLDLWGHSVDSWSDESYVVFGIPLGTTDWVTPVSFQISEETCNSLKHTFNYLLPPEAKVNVNPTPQYWLIQEVH